MDPFHYYRRNENKAGEFMFQYDKRLGISVPAPDQEWLEYGADERQEIMHKWEMIRGKIPDRIHELEMLINEKQHALDHEDDFIQSCRLNTDISDLASIINDLWLWFRTVPDVYPDEKPHA